jgi:hypothetical protein
MPDTKSKPDTEHDDLEKKVDSMMAPDAPDTLQNTSDVEAEVPTVSMSGNSAPAGVPEVPQELTKDLDAFSKDAPDISSEADIPESAYVDQTDVDSMVQKAEPKPRTDVLEDPATDEAVTDIVRGEADTVLDVEDAIVNADDAISKKSIRTWWRSKKLIYVIVFGIMLSIAGLFAWPPSRYIILNAAGVRSQASIKIIDGSTKLPLANVGVKIGAATAKTDEKGVAAFDMVKLGKQPLVIERVAFAEIRKDIVVGWGSNPLGNVELQATGVRYELKVTDFVSGKPLKAEASSGDATASADKNGVIKLVVEDVDKQTVEIVVRVDGYRTEKRTVLADKKSVTEVAMVPDKPIVYVSKQSGKYDVYKIDADGQNKKLLLAGTGRETQEIKVALSPDGNDVVVVSTRGTKRDAAGNLLQSLTLVNIKNTESKTLDDASSVALVDWIDKQLIYIASYAADAKDVTQEQRIVAYNTEESARTALSSGTYFSSVESVAGYVYFAAINDDPAQLSAYQRVRADGSGKQTVLQARVLSVIRTDYGLFSLETLDGWFTYKLGNSEATKAASGPDTGVSRQYVVSPDGAKSVWLDSRDGKGTAVLRDQTTDKETILVAAGGLTAPVRWLNATTFAYRVSNLNETADYVKSTNGGQPRKIANVTNATGLGGSF